MIKTVILVYLLILNVLGFWQMGYDKKKAKNRGWRIPEARLFFVSALGGSVGSLVGMYFFRHKTKHWYFVMGMPAILVFHLLIAGWAILARYGRGVS